MVSIAVDVRGDGAVDSDRHGKEGAGYASFFVRGGGARARVAWVGGSECVPAAGKALVGVEDRLASGWRAPKVSAMRKRDAEN